MDSREFFSTVAERAALSREEAADLTRASLQTLADRLSSGEARDLLIHLPDPLGEELRSATSAKGGVGLDDFLRKVSRHTGLTLDETTTGVRAVLMTLREVVPGDEYDQAMSQLPHEFRDLVASES